MTDILKLKFPNRADNESWQEREYRDTMGRPPGPSVEIGLTLRSGTRELHLTGGKPIKAGLLKAFIV